MSNLLYVLKNMSPKMDVPFSLINSFTNLIVAAFKNVYNHEQAS